MKKIAISIGDLNGIGFEIALKAHKKICRICEPIYLVDKNMALQACELLGKKLPKDFKCLKVGKEFKIKPGTITKKSGLCSFKSFKKAIKLAKEKKVDAIVTLPINKEAWNKAKISYKGHTEVLRDEFKKEAIMMIGCKKLFSILYTQHIPLKSVAKEVTFKKLSKFLLNVQNSLQTESIAVLGLNPHAGDNGVIGNEEKVIKKTIKYVNKLVKREIFYGPLVPDTAFSPKSIKNIKYFIAMYHDQGLIPVKTLYFDESINVTLNLPIIRTSVDHGTAFDIAYEDKNPSIKSYVNAVKEALKLSDKNDIF